MASLTHAFESLKLCITTKNKTRKKKTVQVPHSWAVLVAEPQRHPHKAGDHTISQEQQQ